MVFVNQDKENVGVTFGPANTMIAEHPLMFHSSVVLALARVDVLTYEKTKEAYAIKVRAKVTKNKIAPPFREAEFLIDFKHGIDKMESLLKLAQKLGVVAVAGAYYKIGKSPGFLAKDAPQKMVELGIDLEKLVQEALSAKEASDRTNDNEEGSAPSVATSDPDNKDS
jgi:recombination protein RecA